MKLQVIVLSGLAVVATVTEDGLQAASFFPVSSISSSTAATDLWPVSNLIQGPGVGFDANPPHDRLLGGADGTWVTAAPGGFPADYLAVAGSPVIKLDLGQDRRLTEISVWGYASSNANGLSGFSLRFATEADGPAGYGVSIALNPSFFPTNDDTQRQSFAFGQTAFARYVEFTAEDNFFIPPGDGSGGETPGGDRVGLGEIAFAVPEPVGALCVAAGLGVFGCSRWRRLRGLR